ncbi:MAG: IS982 family transposase [Anaerolineaceae bacterium]|nr:IS982 family transposase [Anaerolineaceae bacterium]
MSNNGVASPPELMIDMETLLTVMFVIVDDWYIVEGMQYLRGKRGVKPAFSDSEMLTLMLAMDVLSYESGRRFYKFVKANYHALFPKLVDRSQFNRRARGLRGLREKLRQHWLAQLGVTLATELLLDTKPVPVFSYKRGKSRSDFAGVAGYGVCASRNLKYYGFKLVILTTLEGMPVVYELVPANSDERVAAEEVLDYVWGCDIFGDKGFIGEEWQLEQYTRHGNRIWTAKRANQLQPNTPAFDRWLNSVRERVEGALNELQNVGRNLERLLAKTIAGLCTRVTVKMANHTLKVLLRRDYDIDIVSFSYIQREPSPFPI